MENTIKKIGLFVLIIGILSVASAMIAVFLALGAGTPIMTGNVAVIPITGEIGGSSDPWTTNVDATQVREWIEDASADDAIKAIVFEIDSPGGSPVASDEIAQAIADANAQNKTTVAWIRESGASGAYWIASATNHIIANRMSFTGSVGVTGSYVEFGGTLRRFNASYQQFKAGEFKEIGTPYQEPTVAERAVYQSKIDKLDAFFVEQVRTRRNLTDDEVAKIKTGEPFLGVEALELHLVDELGGKRELDAYLNATIDEKPEYVFYEKPRSILQDFGLVRSALFPSAQRSMMTAQAQSELQART